MIKKQVLTAIENAIEYHNEQMEKVESLINGEAVKHLTPVSKMDCEFGKWIYGDAKRIQTLLGIQFYKSIETMHEYWHIEYSKIYDLFYYESDGGLLSKIFESRRKTTAQELAQAREEYKKLTRTSDDILEALTASKRRILVLKEEAFKSID